MATLPWNKGIIVSIAKNRFGFLTSIFLFFTFWGSQEGYILLVIGLYWLYNKEIAYRLALVTLGTASLNHTLKEIIRNPRPFVEDGTYEQNWGIEGEAATELADSFSTPSGHAMSSASFWSYFYGKKKSSFFRIFCIFMISMISISRPYLGVHYVEDVILGVIIGVLFTIFVLTVLPPIFAAWNRKSRNTQNIFTLLTSLAIILIAGIISNFEFLGSEFATLLGFITGSVIGNNYEQEYIDFEEKIDYSSKGRGIGIAVVRYLLGAILVILVLVGLDIVFELIADDFSLLGYLLRFIRYLLVALTGLLIVPMIFIKTNLASKKSSS